MSDRSHPAGRAVAPNGLNALIVHDGEYADVLRRALETLQCGFIQVASLSSARRRLTERTPDLFLLDSRLRDGSGFDLCREIRKELRLSRAIVLVFTSSRNVLEGLEWMLADADHCYPRIVNSTRLTCTIQSWLKRHALDTKLRVLNVPGLLIDVLGKTVEFSGIESARLTDRELSFMDHLASAYPHVLSHAEIRARIFDNQPPSLYDRAVREFVCRLKKKLPKELPGTVEAIYGRGYRLNVRPEIVSPAVITQP